MKSFAFLLLAAVLIQTAYSHVIRTGPCGCSSSLISAPVLSAPVYSAVAQPSVAASLADTLSLLTVSSLLAESLPLNPNVVAAVPVPTYAPALAYGGCGCGCGGYNGLGFNYIF
ncbi:hypothetical protein PYW08_011299 [Mythimna loreyi]|uniref:Uncharacterized protein n=1 Tax=Mythimna loreyi TaxID=667449 RepID=A0ACC2Q383_9NEOP|nr:hypothetical protein PYW08_011299 [Mythimna loreyi]